MPQPNLPQTDVNDRQPVRPRQFDDIELLIAASEVESPCVVWLGDQRANEKFITREPAS